MVTRDYGTIRLTPAGGWLWGDGDLNRVVPGFDRGPGGVGGGVDRRHCSRAVVDDIGRRPVRGDLDPVGIVADPDRCPGCVGREVDRGHGASAAETSAALFTSPPSTSERRDPRGR